MDNTNFKNKKTILVLSGGGTKGIVQIGILEKLHNNGLLNDINTISGTSIGAFLGTLYSIGYSPKELHDLIVNTDIDKIKSFDFANIMTNFGFDDGSKFTNLLNKLFSDKNINPQITFGELYKKTKIKIIVTGTCINENKIYYFSHESHNDMSVVLAIRISVSVPLLFTPVNYSGKWFMDGACIDNYPIDIFRNRLDEIIGIYVADKNSYSKINNWEDYWKCFINCLFESAKINSIKGYEKCTIMIEIDYVSIFNTYSTEEKEKLYQIGLNADVMLSGS